MTITQELAIKEDYLTDRVLRQRLIADPKNVVRELSDTSLSRLIEDTEDSHSPRIIALNQAAEIESHNRWKAYEKTNLSK